jgi:hypothetical protein
MELMILNFGHTLSSKCKEQIQEKFPEVNIIEVPLSASFDVRKCLYPQVVSFLNTLNIPLDGSVPYIINVSNLPIVASYILVELAARSGSFPKIIELVRDEALGIFVLKRVVDLEYERRMTRNRKRKYQLNTLGCDNGKQQNSES